jgi:glycosyltransferase involved in cell wall biosynthesis
MEVVVVDGVVSYPPTSGKRLRTLHLMLQQARRHRITYLTRGSGRAEENAQARDFLAGHGITTLIVDDPPSRKKGWRFYADLAANLMSQLPYSVAVHQSAVLARAAGELAATHPVDLWHVEWSGFLHAIPPGRPVVLSAPNVDALIWQRYHETERNPLKRWYIRRQWKKFERFERRAFASAGRVVAVSAEDAALIREGMGLTNVAVVDNGFDRSSFESIVPQPDAEGILFLGSLDWRPNLDAARLLLDEVFPLVRAQEPGVKLKIVGRTPPEWLVKRAREEPGVELHADVPDVRPYLAGSVVQAVPLRIGGGSRLKIIESLASGLPVVSTRVGAEGLCLRPGVEYVLADGPAEMATALVRCLRERAWARGLAEEGRRTVRERYDWAVLAEKLDRVWRECALG